MERKDSANSVRVRVKGQTEGLSWKHIPTPFFFPLFLPLFYLQKKWIFFLKKSLKYTKKKTPPEIREHRRHLNGCPALVCMKRLRHRVTGPLASVRLTHCLLLATWNLDDGDSLWGKGLVLCGRWCILHRLVLAWFGGGVLAFRYIPMGCWFEPALVLMGLFPLLVQLSWKGGLNFPSPPPTLSHPCP